VELKKVDWFLIGGIICIGILALIFTFYPEYGTWLDFSTWSIDSNYLGATLLTVFIICLIGNVLPFPTPYTFIIIPAALSFPTFFWLIALVASVGALIGEIQGYLVGRGGHEIMRIRKSENEKINDWKKLINQRPKLVMFLIFLFGLTPLNDDNIMIPIGLAGFDFKRTVFSCYLGKLGMMLAMAIGGAFGIEFLEKLAGSSGGADWLEGLIVILVTLVIVWAMFKIDIKRFLKEKYGVEAIEDTSRVKAKEYAQSFLIQAHRGASGYEFENSFAAFEKAVELGADFFETDVRQTADGHLILMHDAKLDRTTNGSGKIIALTLKELQQLRLRNGEKIPTLEEILEKFGTKIRINLEIKEKNIEQKVYELIMKYNLKDRVVLSCFSFSTLQKFHTLDKELQLALLTFLPWTIDRLRYSFDKLKKNGITMINPLARFVSTSFVKKAHDAGIQVYPWTVNKKERALQLRDNKKVDGIITNFPDIFRI